MSNVNEEFNKMMESTIENVKKNDTSLNIVQSASKPLSIYKRNLEKLSVMDLLE